jgi:hypothetical protein
VYEPNDTPIVKLFKRIEAASLEDLQALKQEIQTMTFRGDEKATTVALMTARHKHLTKPLVQEAPKPEGNEPWI